jgi:hypothetical protein
MRSTDPATGTSHVDREGTLPMAERLDRVAKKIGHAVGIVETKAGEVGEKL